MQQEVEQTKLDTQQKEIKQKIQSTAKLMELKQQISQGCASKDLDEKLNLIICELMAPLGVDLDLNRSNKALNNSKKRYLPLIRAPRLLKNRYPSSKHKVI